MKDFKNVSVLKVSDLQAEIQAGNFGQQFEGLDGLMYVNLRGRSKEGKRQLLKVAITDKPSDMSVTFLKEVNGIEFYSCAAAQDKAARDSMLLAFGFKESKPSSKPAAGKPATERKKR